MFDALLLARWQFAITTVYHFLFVPLTLGLSIMTAMIQTKYYRTKDPKYKTMTKFWGKLFLINFAMGVATGLVQEFQFGMNWSEYARFMGDIFGAPLAIEALLAFFIESTFLGIWIFGWDRLPKGVHLASIWLVAIASNLSAMWILVANSFMQHPQGYVLNNGRVEMDNFAEIVSNSYFFHQYAHVFTAGLATASFFMLGISAYHLMRKKNLHVMKSSFKFAAVMGLIASLAVAGVGHMQGQYLTEEVPMKMAAMEALWDTEDSAPLALVAGIDTENKENSFEISVPGLLSFMAHNNFTEEVQGINDLQAEYEQEYGDGNYIPDVPLMFWSFRFMVGAGMLMVLSALAACFLSKTGREVKGSKLMVVFLPMMFAPFVANSFGWILTEAGRQPWIVYGLQKTSDAVSQVVSGGSVMVTLVGFTLLYLVLAIIDVALMIRAAKTVEDEAAKPKAAEEGSLWI
ncbi:MAG: cytochrome ubiquinol oxidase subunit I [Peptococcaceae bacterium]|nr:cytochrome ubiquinol oxidase subunit I [Peptococcaceae bacterium]